MERGGGDYLDYLRGDTADKNVAVCDTSDGGAAVTSSCLDTASVLAANHGGVLESDI